MSLFGSFNRVVILGNMTRDAELRTIPSGAVVTDISVAVNERVKKGNDWVDDTTFVDVTAWSKTAEFLQKFGGKGKTVLVEGKLRQDKWVDKQSGQNRSKLKVIADSVTFVDGSKGSGGGGGGGGGYSQQGPADDTPYATQFGGDDDGEPLPF